MTIADHAKKVISFDQTVQVHENLINFGNKLRVVFQKVQKQRSDQSMRQYIFAKINDELDEEMKKMQQVKETMKKSKEELQKDRDAEMKHWRA